MTFKDYFSGHAADYATYRPQYPPALFDWLRQHCQHRHAVWDCATGNGQAAIALTAHFQQVIATDASAAQIDVARAHPQIEYRVALAESSGLPSHSLDLVTVAQALHWFDLAAFYAEVKRVLKPNGLFAVWCYGRPQMQPVALDSVLQHYYSQTLDDFWTPERQWVESGYRSLPFPFAELTPPHYRMQVSWTLDELLGYLYTWSATQRFIAAYGINPLADLADQFLAVGGGDRLSLSWPITLRAGRPP